MTRRPPTEHDESYKQLFSNAVMVQQLLESFVPGKWLERLDFSSLEPVPSSFVSIDHRQRHSDVIWRLRSRTGRAWLYIYLLIEFQSRPNVYMAVRLMTYIGLLYESLLKERVPAESPDEPTLLPAVLPLVIYNGRQRWTRASPLSELVEPLPEELRNFQPEVRYLLLDESSFTDEDLAARRNLVASLFRLENSSRPEDVESRLGPLNEQLADLDNTHVEHAFDVWLERVVRLKFPVLNVGEIRGREGRTMLAERIDEWIEESEQRFEKGLQKGFQQGRAEGRAEGNLDGHRDLLLRLLRSRFGEVPPEARKRIAAITSVEELARLATEVHRVESLAGLIGPIKPAAV